MRVVPIESYDRQPEQLLLLNVLPFLIYNSTSSNTGPLLLHEDQCSYAQPQMFDFLIDEGKLVGAIYRTFFLRQRGHR
jgi:hypothetical protein